MVQRKERVLVDCWEGTAMSKSLELLELAGTTETPQNPGLG